MGGLRILVLLHGGEPGGVEKIALQLAAAWVTAGADVCVVTRRGSGALPSVGFATLQTIWTLASTVRRYRPDVVFGAGGADALAAVALRWRLGRTCPPTVLKISHDLTRGDLPAPLRWAYRRWARLQGRWIAHFVGMAAPARAEIAAIMHVAADRISIVEHPALTAAEVAQLFVRRRRRDWRREGCHYVAAGQLVAQKNFALLIAAFADVAQPHDRLTIVGEGPQRRALETLAREAGVGDRVALPGDAVVSGSWLTAADVFVLSSDFEQVPAVIVEALAAGLPIVATDCSDSMVKLLDHGRLGRLVPVGDRERLGHALREVLTVATCSACALAQAARFTVEFAAPRYLELFVRLRRGDAAPAVDGDAGLGRCAVCRPQPHRHHSARLLTEA